MLNTLVDDLLAKQRCLTPVARFAKAHESGRHALAKKYRDLIPLSQPKPGERYAFEVNLDQCTGCKACVAACHSLNGLEENETWREVGLLLGGTPKRPALQTVTSACHHCEDPGCLNGCPVLAYEKDPVTGIVRHLDDQCIGCSYCIMKCPYEVPKFSKRLGIVRKCDMCHHRLAEGEAPACVQACPTSAIAIRLTRKDAILTRAESLNFLPDTPDPRITKPSTTYVSKREISNRMLASDHFSPSVQHTHWPLVIMLVLTQAGLGLLAAAGAGWQSMTSTVAGVSCVFVGLVASVMHLGQPLKAWRAFLGWRRSWLSREILAMGPFGGFSLLCAVALFWPQATAWRDGLLSLTLLSGALAVCCSAWVYHDTHRQVWRGFLSFGRFFWTVAVFALPNALAWVLGGKMLWEVSLMLRGIGTQAPEISDFERMSRLLRGPLLPLVCVRLACGVTAILSMPQLPIVALAAALLGELLERAVFFKSGVAAKMPGLA